MTTYVHDRPFVVAALREIASLLELSNASRFKVRAFERGARALEASKAPLGELIESRRLLDLPNIGPAIAKQIEDLHREGRSDLLDSLREGLPRGVLELAQVPGIGLHALEALHTHGIATVADLRDAAASGTLREVKGFGERREARVLAAVERYETMAPKVRLADGLALADSITDEIAALEGVRAVHLAGGLRRAFELSDEIVFVVAADDPSRVNDRLARTPRAARVEEKNEHGCRVRLPDGTRVAFLVAPPPSIAALLVRATSSDAHWRALEEAATARGLRLEASGLYRGAHPVRTNDEAALYHALGLGLVPAEAREGAEEARLVAGGRDLDLVDVADVRGFVHCHTTWSDGADDIEAMARAAEARGARFITITDHSGTAHYARGLDVDRLERQWDAIAAVQERVKIRILRGTEADILADGALDWPDAILERLDVVIASIHSRYRQDEAKMTERVLRAMRHPCFKIWGHPMGRLVTSRPPIPLRVEEVLDALAASRGAIEINGDPYRLDLEPKWVRAARARDSARPLRRRPRDTLARLPSLRGRPRPPRGGATRRGPQYAIGGCVRPRGRAGGVTIGARALRSG